MTKRAGILAICLALPIAAIPILLFGVSPSDEGPELLSRRPSHRRALSPCEPLRGPGFADPPTNTPSVKVRTVQDGLKQPTTIVFLDDEIALVGEREGRIVRWNRITGDTEVVLDERADTSSDADQGLVGMAIGPQRRFLYVNRVDGNNVSRITAYPMTGAEIRSDQPLEIISQQQNDTFHMGGKIAFDSAGTLWFSFGDGGSLGDPYNTAQDPQSLHGSIMRIVPRPGQTPSAIGAPGNPWLNSINGSEFIFAIGARNPYGLTIDPLTQDIWIGDVGQECVEEIDVLTARDAGANLGWNYFEGDRRFIGIMQEPHHAPVFTYASQDGFCAVVGGIVYRGSKYPILDGLYLFSDFCNRELLVLDPASQVGWISDAEIPLATGFFVSPTGEILVTSLNGEILEVFPS